MSSDSETEVANSLQEDYYSFLGVHKQASQNEINNAYHRLSRIYHPDKHSEPHRKKEAIELFNRVKKAHEVLSDEQKRAIYDTLGEKGLNTTDWKLVAKTKTPEEIREEFERLKEKRQQRLMQQRTNARGSLNVEIDATDLFRSKRRRKRQSVDLLALLSLPRLSISSMAITQAVDLPLSSQWQSQLSGALKSDNQRHIGSGQVIGNFRRQFSDRSWAELQVSGGQGPMFMLRGSKAVTSQSVVTSSLLLHFMDNGIGANAEFAIGKQFSKYVVGYLTWKAGLNSALSTAVVYDRDQNRFQAQIEIGYKDCFLALSYLRRLSFNNTKIKAGLRLSLLGSSIDYGCQTKLTKHSQVGAAMSIMETGNIVLKLKLIRGNNSYVFDLTLADELMPAPILYGTFVPIIGFYCVKELLILPYKNAEKRRKQTKLEQENADKLLERKRQAQSSIELMRSTYERSVERERNAKGLVIVRAIYGNQKNLEQFVAQFENDEVLNDSELLTEELTEVTIPLQCLVRDSTLCLPEASKSYLPGFFDTSLGENKQLYVRYELRGQVSTRTYMDLEKVTIP